MATKVDGAVDHSLELLHETYVECGHNPGRTLVVLMNAAVMAGRIASQDTDLMKRMIDEFTPHADNTIRLLEVAKGGLTR